MIITKERWEKLSLVEQFANVGSEVERALELMDITLSSLKGFPKLKEAARVKEVLVDHFFGDNEYGFTEEALKKYFSHFTSAARRLR